MDRVFRKELYKTENRAINFADIETSFICNKTNKKLLLIKTWKYFTKEKKLLI